MKDHVKRFSMPAGALVAAPVGARFHPTLARCQRLDSSLSPSTLTIKRPRVSTDHLVWQTMLQRHDHYPPGKPDAGHQARSDGGSRLYKIAHPRNLLRSDFVCLIQTGPTADHAIINQISA